MRDPAVLTKKETTQRVSVRVSVSVSMPASPEFSSDMFTQSPGEIGTARDLVL